MSFPRYPKYKDSGVEWLGEVPEEWEVCAFRHCLSSIFNGLTSTQVDEAEQTVPVTRIETISAGVIDESRLGFIKAEDAREDRKLRYGDILFSNINSLNMIGNCAIYLGGREIYGGMNLLVLRPAPQHNPRWLYWLVRSSGFREVVESLAKPAINQASISQSSICSIVIPVAAVTEQSLLATFLDRETAKIDGLMAEKQRLIELLKEKRQAVISHVVTKGLNPHAPMKPSGIEWLGAVPEHWDCAVLTRIASRIVVGIAEAATHAYADEGIPILRSTNIRAGSIVGDILFIAPEFADDRRSKQISAGDLVTVRTGNAGVTVVIPPELDGCQCFTMLITTLDSSSVAAFYCYWMNSVSAQCYFSLEGWGTAQVNISVPILKALPVPIPPASEQRAIVAYIDRETARIDALTAEAQRAIELLQERRTALISAAVTGKIDVRGLATAEAC